MIALGLAAAVVLRVGAQRQKTAMTAVLLCWIAATLGQIATGRLLVPLIVGDVVFSLWLLWFAWRKPEWWVLVLLAIEGARLVMHATIYGASAGVPYALLNNTLSLAGLAVLAAAALVDARLRARRQGPQPEARPVL